MAEAGSERTAERPLLGRRRRRLYWTVGLLAVFAAGGGALGISLLRGGRPATYKPGEESAAITRRLDLGIPAEAPQPAWDDVTAAAGLGEFRSFLGARTSQLPEDMGAGAAWGDVEGDGDDDLFLVAAGGPVGAPAEALARSRLYLNRGDGSFVEDATFPDTRILGMGAAWGDYDGDGALDLVVTGYDNLLLFHNEAGRLVRDDAIASRPGFWTGASWSDFDRDGDLDLYICGYVRYVADAEGRRRAAPQYGRAVPYTLNPASFEPEHNLLFRNDGATFVEAAESLGVHNPQGRSMSAIWHDFDDDGWPDLYVANDISDNALYLNRGGRFEDTSHAAWVADHRGAMGLAVGDWNRDGDDDLFITHWIAQENALYDSLLGTLEGRQLRFVDVADRVGLGQIALSKVGWGTEFADFDADGWLDLAVANGSTLEDDQEPPGLKPQAAFLFWNRSGEAFHDLAPLNPALAEPRVSRGLAVADHDLDGDLDLLIVDRDGGVRLFANRMRQGHAIQVRLVGARLERGGRRPADGARLVVEAGGVQHRRTLGGASYLSQSSRTLHVGLGEAEHVDRLTMHWPDGSVDEHVALDVDRLWEIEAGSATPVGYPPRGERSATPANTSGLPAGERERVVAFWAAQRAAMRTMKVDEDPVKAIGLFREALALDPAHEDSLYYLANCLADTGDVAGALDNLAELMRRNPLSHRAYKRWGTLTAIHATTKRGLDEAAAALERAVEINREETGALLVLAEVALLQGDGGGARQRLEWVLRTNPQSQGALFLLAYLEWKAGNDAATRALLERAGRAREARRPPSAASAEGDVRRTMHRDVTPLLDFVEDWNGQDGPAAAFAALDGHLTRHPS